MQRKVCTHPHPHAKFQRSAPSLRVRKVGAPLPVNRGLKVNRRKSGQLNADSNIKINNPQTTLITHWRAACA